MATMFVLSYVRANRGPLQWVALIHATSENQKHHFPVQYGCVELEITSSKSFALQDSERFDFIKSIFVYDVIDCPASRSVGRGFDSRYLARFSSFFSVPKAECRDTKFK
jgi:hypothetical protein